MNTTTSKTFSSTNAAHAWLSNNSGLWAGLSYERQHEIHDCLEADGRATIQTPSGDSFEAIVAAS